MKTLPLVLCSLFLLSIFTATAWAQLPPVDAFKDTCAFDGRGGRKARVAVIGDFGSVGPSANAVANMVDSWDPDIVVTTGDNNYPLGLSVTFDLNVGSMYHKYIFPYKGNFGPGEAHGINRFFPVLGNHDWYVISDDDLDFLPDTNELLPGFDFEWPWERWTDDDNDDSDDNNQGQRNRVPLYMIPGVIIGFDGSGSLSSDAASRLNVTRLFEVLAAQEPRVFVHGLNITQLAVQALQTNDPGEMLSWLLRVRVQPPASPSPPPPMPRFPWLPPIRPIWPFKKAAGRAPVRKGEDTAEREKEIKTAAQEVRVQRPRLEVHKQDLPGWIEDLLGGNIQEIWDFELIFRNDLPDPYLNYFTLPGNERYYQYSCGPIDFFALDSYWKEPDGISSTSTQANWLRERLAASRAERPDSFRIVVLHHPPYTSSNYLFEAEMRWPFKEWGADLILAGHNHVYETLRVDELLYVVNGKGGAYEIYGNGDLENVDPNSLFRYKDSYGAMLITVEQNTTNGLLMTQSEFWSIDHRDNPIDIFTLSRPLVTIVPPPLVPPPATPPATAPAVPPETSPGGSASQSQVDVASSQLVDTNNDDTNQGQAAYFDPQEAGFEETEITGIELTSGKVEPLTKTDANVVLGLPPDKADAKTTSSGKVDAALLHEAKTSRSKIEAQEVERAETQAHTSSSILGSPLSSPFGWLVAGVMFGLLTGLATVAVMRLPTARTRGAPGAAATLADDVAARPTVEV